MKNILLLDLPVILVVVLAMIVFSTVYRTRQRKLPSELHSHPFKVFGHLKVSELRRFGRTFFYRSKVVLLNKRILLLREAPIFGWGKIVIPMSVVQLNFDESYTKCSRYVSVVQQVGYAAAKGKMLFISCHYNLEYEIYFDPGVDICRLLAEYDIALYQ